MAGSRPFPPHACRNSKYPFYFVFGSIYERTALSLSYISQHAHQLLSPQSTRPGPTFITVFSCIEAFGPCSLHREFYALLLIHKLCIELAFSKRAYSVPTSHELVHTPIAIPTYYQVFSCSYPCSWYSVLFSCSCSFLSWSWCLLRRDWPNPPPYPSRETRSESCRASTGSTWMRSTTGWTGTWPALFATST